MPPKSCPLALLAVCTLRLHRFAPKRESGVLLRTPISAMIGTLGRVCCEESQVTNHDPE